MSSVTHFTQHLLKLDPQKSAARQALFHYLKFFCEKEEPVTAVLIDAFYRLMFNFKHWQDNNLDLGRVVAADLASFSLQHRLPFQVGELRHADRLQVVHLHHADDVEELIRSQLNLGGKAQDKLRMVAFDENQTLALIFNPQTGLKVRSFQHFAVIQDGSLRLLEPMTDLLYNQQLELLSGVTQTLLGPHNTVARFVVTGHGSHGMLLRGHALQKYEALSGMGLSLYPEIYHSLKRVERHYIRPESDPFYQDLIGLLEKVYQAVSLNPQQVNRKSVEIALQKGKSALKNIFPNDKLLLLLVTNIEYHLLNQERAAPAANPEVPPPWPMIDPSV